MKNKPRFILRRWRDVRSRGCFPVVIEGGDLVEVPYRSQTTALAIFLRPYLLWFNRSGFSLAIFVVATATLFCCESPYPYVCIALFGFLLIIWHAINESYIHSVVHSWVGKYEGGDAGGYGGDDDGGDGPDDPLFEPPSGLKDFFEKLSSKCSL